MYRWLHMYILIRLVTFTSGFLLNKCACLKKFIASVSCQYNVNAIFQLVEIEKKYIKCIVFFIISV